MEYLVLPRDLRSWHNLPVSAIAPFKPVVITDMGEAALKDILNSHPYRHFPVVVDDQLRGIAKHTEIELAIAGHRPEKLDSVPSSRLGDTIRGG